MLVKKCNKGTTMDKGKIESLFFVVLMLFLFRSIKTVRLKPGGLIIEIDRD